MHLINYLLGISLICISSLAAGQDTTPAPNRPIVQCRLEYPVQVRAGDSVSVYVIMDIAPGFYIYAPTELNQLQEFQVMKLMFTELPFGIKKLGTPLLPPYAQQGTAQVYRGNGLKFMQRLQIEKAAKPGSYTLKAKLTTQACDQQICYPPVVEFMDVVITVALF